MSAPLRRDVFKTSRTMEFCSKKELTNQTGHPETEWPLVILKELLDNALDAAEEMDVAPVIKIRVSTEMPEIVIADNGPGISPETVASLLDFTVRVSSREAYVSPTRGAQGNALKTLIAMPFALDGRRGVTVIAARGIANHIAFGVDQLRQVPVIDHTREPSPTTKGTRITVRWPDSASSILVSAKSLFYKLPTTSPGSTRICASRSSGTVRFWSTERHPIRCGRSGDPTIRHRRTGTMCPDSSATSLRMLAAIKIWAAIVPFARSSAKSASSLDLRSRSWCSKRPV